ncbi:MAG: leucine-rich repeat domain-containing protein [Ruminococcaceae bacterium]|nr:leucine-rich repeat domain-containing protein [Oscillospiraceae bacterium]
MKKTLIPCLILCLALTGCVTTGGDGYGTDAAPDNNASNTQISLDAAEQRATYYQNLAAQLEEEILTVKSELFTSRMEYEAQISELQTKLNAALAEKEEAEKGTNADKDETADFRFTVSEGRATLVSYTGNDKEVTVPSHFEGSPVVAISDRAFENNTRITRVILPAGVETVGWFAFSGCIGLSEIVIPDSVKSISYGAFLNCNSSLLVCCTADSYAARYAQSYGIKLKQ